VTTAQLRVCILEPHGFLTRSLANVGELDDGPRSCQREACSSEENDSGLNVLDWTSRSAATCLSNSASSFVAVLGCSGVDVELEDMLTCLRDLPRRRISCDEVGRLAARRQCTVRGG
jgi:hypothetical protein